MEGILGAETSLLLPGRHPGTPRRPLAGDQAGLQSVSASQVTPAGGKVLPFGDRSQVGRGPSS